jgi:transposase
VIDSTTMAANASMKSIIRHDTNESYAGYVKRLAKEAGEKLTTKAELAQFDRKREGRSTSNADWKAPADDDARITKMKDGRTRFVYKPEHVVDAETDVIIAATMNHANASDHTTAPQTLLAAQRVLDDLGLSTNGATLIADKGYHSNALLVACVTADLKTCIAEPRSTSKRRWTNKPEIAHRAVTRNRRRLRSKHGLALMRRRGQSVERTFADVYHRGGMRQTYLRGLENNEKRSLLAVAAHNLGVLMRKLCGAGTPKALAVRFSMLYRVLVLVMAQLGIAWPGRRQVVRIGWTASDAGASTEIDSPAP